MEPIASIIKRRAPLRGAGKATERGRFMSYFCKRINVGRVGTPYPMITMARMGKLLEKIPTKDLYYLKRVCDDSASFSKRFWYELNPHKHENKTV
jgi:hypothetical protein